ncbi:MAG TPA: GntR family transcriptional regulator [Planctomycetota bacterium]|nr:GntR family transcriptional regulator [Planctomycetota bacterium]
MTLSAFIRGDVKARILDGTLAGKVTLRELSQRYGASLTPVREAVDALVRERVIDKGSSGRLVIPASRPRPSVAPEAPPALRDWPQEIARDILRRSLRGEEAFVREEAAARAYGVGRTILRHVFSRLAGAGMLEHVPRRGWRVRPFREEDMAAFLDVRELLELRALDLAAPRLVKEDLERILALNLPAQGCVKVDTELHPYLLARCENRFIQDFFRRHGAYYTTLFHYAAHSPETAAVMARQHRGILEHLIARRWEKARAALGSHIRDQAPALRNMMTRLARLPVDRWPRMDSSPGPLA